VCLIYKIYLLLVAKYTLSEVVLSTACYIFIISLIWFGNQVKVETIFFLMSTIQPLTPAFKMLIPRGMHELVKMTAVLKRIERFFISLNSQNHLKRENKNNVPTEIKLSNLDVHVGNRKIIENINFKIDSGLMVLTGPMASGKSLLLHVIMEEYQSVEGNLSINGKISYASQEPWLFPSTIKQNILFGENYDEKRYLKVLQVCALIQDIQCVQGGDGFIVADRGINLSKGQQSRINLARAVYRDCDIYLLDDCLSNLDVFVGDYIFEKCIKGFLKEKLVILTTQNPKYIRGADHTVIVNNQRLQQVSNKTSFKDNCSNCTVEWKEERVPENVIEEDFLETSTLIAGRTIEKNIYEEKLESGNVKLKSFKKYIEHSGGLRIFITICIVFGAVQFYKSGMKKLENNWSVWYYF
jgi:ATP-binding cassette subfamily C (CFTR/MRP) protein 4